MSDKSIEVSKVSEKPDSVDKFKVDQSEVTPPQYVRLVSNDDHEFFIKSRYASTSSTIKSILSCAANIEDNQSNQIFLKEIPSHILIKVCQYFMYKIKYAECAGDIPEFHIPPNIALELLMAANYLDC
ncbi:hypothetical protein A3Q56_00785 [Intoshia linei]|uniref:Elongin-C n=1 Tax=Intoshia linei TaxID=1819745 RepID=A0A177BAU4_9BILA|nr:hypothetical protein A3Q56_00785 [Intoshia linei]